MTDLHDPRAPRPRRRRKLPPGLPVLLGTGLGLLAGLGYGLTATPQYTATGYVMVVPRPGTDPATALGFAQAYGRIVTGSAVLAGAQATTHTAAAVLKDHVRAATSPDAPMISVTGTSPRAGAAADIANAVARSLAATGDRDSAGTGVRLVLFSPAAAPTAPTSPSAPLSAAVGASAGALLGALLLLTRPKNPSPPPPTPVPGPSLAEATRAAA